VSDSSSISIHLSLFIVGNIDKGAAVKQEVCQLELSTLGPRLPTSGKVEHAVGMPTHIERVAMKVGFGYVTVTTLSL
jgi:hypothetical protein